MDQGAITSLEKMMTMMTSRLLERISNLVLNDPPRHEEAGLAAVSINRLRVKSSTQIWKFGHTQMAPLQSLNSIAPRSAVALPDLWTER
jgi:hypothetical protein